MKRTASFLIPVITIFFFIFASSCREDRPKKADNILNVALTSKVSTLDHALSYDTVSAEVVYQIHEPLFEYEYLIRPYTLKPLTAAEMPLVTDGGKTYTVKIKKGIYFHPHDAFKGKRELQAKDFITQIKRIAYLPTQSKGWWLFDDKIIGLDEFREKAKSLEDFFSLPVPGLKVLDDHTLQIKLKEPYPQLNFALAMSFTAPAPAELVKFFKNDLSVYPIGTGPFLFSEWNKNLSITLKANPLYHEQTYPKTGDRFAYENKLLEDAGKKIPFLDGVKFHVMKEASPRMQSFQTKKIDYVTLSKDYFQMALNYQGELSDEFKKQKIQLQAVPTLTYWWLAFNMKDEVVGKNLKLRQAIAHAIDNERLIELFTHNVAQKANSIYPPGIPGYDPSAELPYKYDPKKAKELLAQAGFPEGKGLPVLNYDIRGNSTVSRQMGEFIKSELEKIGVEIKVIVNTFPGFLKKAENGNLQFWQGGWSLDYPDVQNIIQLLSSGNHPPGPNTAFYSHPEVDRIYKKVSTQQGMEPPIEEMKQVESLVHKDLPWVMQYYSRNYVLYHQRVKNFRPSDLIYNSMKYIRLD